MNSANPLLQLLVANPVVTDCTDSAMDIEKTHAGESGSKPDAQSSSVSPPPDRTIQVNGRKIANSVFEIPTGSIRFFKLGLRPAEVFFNNKRESKNHRFHPQKIAYTTYVDRDQPGNTTVAVDSLDMPVWNLNTLCDSNLVGHIAKGKIPHVGGGGKGGVLGGSGANHRVLP